MKNLMANSEKDLLISIFQIFNYIKFKLFPLKMMKKWETNLKYTKSIGTSSIIFPISGQNINHYLDELEPLIRQQILKGSCKIQLVLNYNVYSYSFRCKKLYICLL